MSRLLLKFEVESDFVDTRSGTKLDKNGREKDWEVHSQKLWVYLGSKFPKEMQLTLETPRDALRPGLYECDILPALDVGDFGRLVIDGRRLRFQPVAASPAKAA